VRLGCDATVPVGRRPRSRRGVVATGTGRGRPDLPGAPAARLDGDDPPGAMTGSTAVRRGRVEAAGGRGLAISGLLRAARALRSRATDRVRSLSRLCSHWGGGWWTTAGAGRPGAAELLPRQAFDTVLDPGRRPGCPGGSEAWTAVRRAGGTGSRTSATPWRARHSRRRRLRVRGRGEARGGRSVWWPPRSSPRPTMTGRLRARGRVEAWVAGDAGEVGYIEGAIQLRLAVAPGSLSAVGDSPRRGRYRSRGLWGASVNQSRQPMKNERDRCTITIDLRTAETTGQAAVPHRHRDPAFRATPTTTGGSWR